MKIPVIDPYRLDLSNPLELGHPLAQGLQHFFLGIPGRQGGVFYDVAGKANATLPTSSIPTWRTWNGLVGLNLTINTNTSFSGKLLSSNLTVFAGGQIGNVPSGNSDWIAGTACGIRTSSFNLVAFIRFTGNNTQTVNIYSGIPSNTFGCAQITHDGATFKGYWNGANNGSTSVAGSPENCNFSKFTSNFSNTNHIYVFMQYNRLVDASILADLYARGFAVNDGLVRWTTNRKTSYPLGPAFVAKPALSINQATQLSYTW